MVKLLICDDEVKICRLIKNLINWEELGAEVVGMAYDGLTAMRIADEQKPDIIITDIRMPGMDGLDMIRRIREQKMNTDFIIISGYRQFDYAQKAIRYGVEDYIVKPINEKELYQMVSRIIDKRSRNRSLIRGKESAEMQLRENQKLMQSNYLSRLLDGGKESADGHRHLDLEGTMRAVLIKPDIDCTENGPEIYQALLRKVGEIVEEVFGRMMLPYVSAVKDEGVFLILSYDEAVDLNNILRRLKRKIISQSNTFFPRFTITIGIGGEKSSLSGIGESIEGARRAVLSRLFIGTGEIIREEELPDEAGDAGTELFSHTAKGIMLDKIEIFDAQGVYDMVRSIGLKLEGMDSTGGTLVRKLAESILRVYLFGTEVLRGDGSEQEIRDRWSLKFCMCQSAEEVFGQLGAFLRDDLQALTEQKNQAQLRPIRDARKYLQDHYNEAVRLEDVAEKLGFNSAYFSTLFKKETGKTFSEYLIKLRISRARNLLTDTSDPVADISEQVGYTDLKYFSKIFKRETGLTPSEYRKLYQKVQ